jgi:hypothetical protein
MTLKKNLVVLESNDSNGRAEAENTYNYTSNDTHELE